MDNLSNFSSSTLSSSILSSDLSLSLSSLSSFPSPPFLLTVDQEVLRCTAVAGSTLTVARGQEGSTAADHAAGAVVRAGLTVGGLVGQIVGRQATGQEVVRGLSSITASSGVWQDVRDDSTLEYVEMTLTVGRYLVLAQADAVLQGTKTGTMAISFGGRVADTLGSVYGPESSLVYVTDPGKLSLGHVSWSALATLSSSRTLRMQAARFDQVPTVTWQNSFFLAPTLQAIRLGD